MPNTSKILKASPLIALFFATITIGFAPILVRLCDTTSASISFWRMVFSTPILGLAWVLLPSPTYVGDSKKSSYKDYGILILAGTAFAFDLIAWNFALQLTPIANAALFINFAPLFIALISWGLLRQTVMIELWLGMLISIVGGILLVWPHLQSQGSSLVGDGMSLLAACFYGVYMMAIQSARRIFNTWSIMTLTSAVTGIVSLIMALLLNQTLLVASAEGWVALIILAIVVQVIGQSLIAYALAALSATFSSIILLLQPVISAIAAWWVFGEYLETIQFVGMIIVLCGIGFAKTNYLKSAKNNISRRSI